MVVSLTRRRAIFLLIFLAWSPFSSPADEPQARERFQLFLGERLAFLPVDRKVPRSALPDITLRGDADEKNLILRLDCDARNLNLPDGPQSPFTLDVTFGETGKEGISIHLAGLRVQESAPLEPSGGAAPIPRNWAEGIKAVQEVRPDGVWRVTLRVPLPLLPSHDNIPETALAITWRQLTGSADDGSGIYADSGALSLNPGGPPILLIARPPVPTDVVSMLLMYYETPDGLSSARAMERIQASCRQNDALLGALALALDHSHRPVRRSAAKVWLDWPDKNTDDLQALRAKARAVLSSKSKP